MRNIDLHWNQESFVWLDEAQMNGIHSLPQDSQDVYTFRQPYSVDGKGRIKILSKF